MASIPGGSADKLGNEFERLWTVRHLIQVLAGDAISVQIEALGHDERGTEFWVSLPNGIRQAHQAKRENGSHGAWSAADLNAKGVLKHAKFQLDRDPKHEFIFLSGDKAPSLADLNERAMRGDSDDDFYTIATATTAKLKSELDAVARYLELDPVDLEQRAAIREFLRRFHVRVVDKQALRGEVEDLAGRWVSGDPATVVSVLESFISRNENMGRSLRQGDVIAVLPPGSTPMDLRKDPSLSKQPRWIGHFHNT